MKKGFLGVLSCLLLALLLSACGGSGASTQSDGDTSADGDVTENESADDDTGDNDGAALDLSVALKAKETRAGKITKESEFIGGPMAKGKLGDYKLYNSRIRVVVEGLRESDGWGSFGGTIADADIVRPAGEPGQSLFSEYFFGFGLRLQNPDKVEVLNDGTNGEAAVLRFTGPDADLPLVAAAFTGILKPTLLNTTITVDYVLPPDSDLLEIRSSFIWKGSARVDLDYILQIFILGDGLKNFKVGPGFDKDGHNGPTDIYVTAGPKVSYGFFGQEGQIKQMFNYEGVTFYKSEKRRILPGETVTFVRYVAVTEGGADPVLRTYNAWKKTADLAHVRGQVKNADGTSAAGARVHVLNDNAAEGQNYGNQAVANGDGRYELTLPAGSYTLIPFVDGTGALDGRKLTLAKGQEAELDLTLPQAAQLRFEVTDGAGAALPCKIFADRTDGRLAPTEAFGEFLWHAGHQWVVHSESGRGTIPLPAGTYTITASRGYEYSFDAETLTLTAGQETKFSGALTRVVDTAGFVSSDFHLHSKASQDSDVSYEDRIRSSVSEGLEAPISTDHDIIVDWQPAAKTLGVSDWVQPIVGLEITTITYGHFNAWPLLVDPTRPNNGAYSWYDKSAPDLFAEVAATPEHPLMIVNHPRNASIAGYFSSVQYDAASGEFGSVAKWSSQFDAIEIINGGDLTTALEKTLPDWYSFLNRGYRFAGAAGTDNHKLTNEVGAVRNWIASSRDEPAKIDPFELAANVRALKLIVSNGPFIRFTIGEAGLGETVTDTDGTVGLKIQVQAPTYMDVKRLSIIGNGEVVKEADLTGLADPQNPVLRYDATLELAPTADTWYIVIVEGDNGFLPISAKRPFAFTNPIFVDVDGNKRFDAPLKPTTP